MGVLDRILESKREEVARMGHDQLPSPPEPRAIELRRPPGGGLRLLAEIKRRSPSAGPLSTRLSVAERARVYERAGARMVSVLCDPSYFDGDYRHLAEARAHCSLPLLCKDFVIDEVQLDWARAWGADAVLLIARCLSRARLGELMAAAEQRNLVALVEVANRAEARTAVDAGAELIGVNARDLDTLELDVGRARELLASLPEHVTSIHLSGIKSPEDVRDVAASAAHAALVGEALMRLDDPQDLLAELVAAAG